MNGGIVDEAATRLPSSATSKVKFMCSHGGKILPRPTDNQMKYVGGETRIVAVYHDITYAELMNKLCVLFDGDIVLKYQLASEDLESLVSVRSDEDLKYMFEEYTRQERGGVSKLRAFLFPANPLAIDNDAISVDTHALEQRYIDAINGIIRANRDTRNTDTTPKPTISSSACSSPKSSSAEQQMDVMSQDTISVHSYQTTRGMNQMHKVHSSPSLHNLNNGINMGNPQHQAHHRQHHHARSPSLPPPPSLQSYHSQSPNPHKVVGMEKSMLAVPVTGRVDMAGRSSFSGYPTVRYHRGGGQHYDDSDYI